MNKLFNNLRKIYDQVNCIFSGVGVRRIKLGLLWNIEGVIGPIPEAEGFRRR